MWKKKWRKVKTTYYNLLDEYSVCPIDVVHYNKKTKYVTWLDYYSE